MPSQCCWPIFALTLASRTALCGLVVAYALQFKGIDHRRIASLEKVTEALAEPIAHLMIDMA